MTRNQYNKIAEAFAINAGKSVKYSRFVPSLGKKIEHTGILYGIGIGVNADNIIINQTGYTYAVHFSDVKMPK